VLIPDAQDLLACNLLPLLLSLLRMELWRNLLDCNLRKELWLVDLPKPILLDRELLLPSTMGGLFNPTAYLGNGSLVAAVRF
jgi:hypothetical protein